jgi:hypothetical protein
MLWFHFAIRLTEQQLTKVITTAVVLLLLIFA